MAVHAGPVYRPTHPCLPDGDREVFPVRPPNKRVQRTRSASLRSPLTRHPLGAGTQGSAGGTRTGGGTPYITRTTVPSRTLRLGPTRQSKPPARLPKTSTAAYFAPDVILTTGRGWPVPNKHVMVSVGNSVDLRLPSESLIAPFIGTAYVPRDRGYFIQFGGCDVIATGIFAENPEDRGYFVFLVLKLVPSPDRSK